jgi:hypothetical protein
MAFNCFRIQLNPRCRILENNKLSSAVSIGFLQYKRLFLKPATVGKRQ